MFVRTNLHKMERAYKFYYQNNRVREDHFIRRRDAFLRGFKNVLFYIDNNVFELYVVN